MITLKRLKEVLSYDPETGEFRWAAPRPKIRVGEIAGTKIPEHNMGRIMILIDGKRYAAHRLAWLYTHGRWPKNQIDHIDLNRQNNRIVNLREATNGQNCANRRCFGKSGLKGASFSTKSGKWHAQITHKKRCISLGFYDSAEEAHAVYVAKAIELHGEFARAA